MKAAVAVGLVAFLQLLASEAVCSERIGASDQEMQRLVTLNKQSVNTQVKKDLAAFSAMLAENVVFVSADGLEANKNDFIKELRSDQRAYRNYELDDPNIRVFGSTAVITGVARVEGIARGAPFRGTYRYAKTLIKNAQGKWLIVLWQSTPVSAR